MKKIIPIVTLIGIGTLLTGCNSVANVKNEKFDKTIENFQNQIENCGFSNKLKDFSTKFKNYNLSITANDTINTEINTTNNNQILPTEQINDISGKESSEISHTNTSSEINTTDIPNINSDSVQTNEVNEDQSNTSTNNDMEYLDNTDITTDNDIDNEISTLYSLSDDIEDSCDDFCELKEEISEAIVETQELITKVQNKDIDLSLEQKLYITQQAQELKQLGKRLSNITTELSLNLSDISTILQDENGNIDNLSLKYLLVLDNLANGNEMLANSLSSLYMINSMINMQSPYNQGRLQYRYQKNNETPIIKDYIIEDGEVKENTPNTSTENTEASNNLDTYLNTNTNNNLDTYGNNYSNIDTFFNTALLDNELYGNTGMYGYGYNNLYGRQLPQQNLNNNSTNGVNNTQSTQQIENKTSNSDVKKDKKKFKLTSNIDTYRDQNTPTLSARIQSMKESINEFFGKFKPRKNNAENPIYKLTESQKND